MHLEDLVTVVIPAADEEASIGACLDSVLAQAHDRLQVVVVDGASTDRTPDIVRARMAADPRVEMVRNPRRNIPSSLNLGLAQARGEWLVRVDAHSTVPPDYVGTAVDLLREERWGGVGGRKDAVARSHAGQAISVALGSRLGVGNSTYHHGEEVQTVDHLPFGAYPTGLLRELGGWDEDLTANEDFELDYRIRQTGRDLLFDPRLRIEWRCRETVGELYAQYFRYGRGKADVVLLHPLSLSPRHLVPPAFVVYLGGCALLALRRPGTAAALLAPYAVAVGVESVRCGRALDEPHERAWLPAAFVAMHLGWGLGLWSRLRERALAPRRRPAADPR